MTSKQITTTFDDFETEVGEFVQIKVSYTGHYNFGACGIDLESYEIVDNFDDYELNAQDVRNLEMQCEWDWDWLNGENG